MELMLLQSVYHVKMQTLNNYWHLFGQYNALNSYLSHTIFTEHGELSEYCTSRVDKASYSLKNIKNCFIKWQNNLNHRIWLLELTNWYLVGRLCIQVEWNVYNVVITDLRRGFLFITYLRHITLLHVFKGGQSEKKLTEQLSENFDK